MAQLRSVFPPGRTPSDPFPLPWDSLTRADRSDIVESIGRIKKNAEILWFVKLLLVISSEV